ncbi:MAG: hypothetical protein LLF94_12740 [Chlamydiales bacterium]|nr:hypothetical protein [Chlamydiales bacterium]
MHAQVGQNPYHIQQLEVGMVQKVQIMKEAHFGDAKVVIDENDPQYDALKQAIATVVKPFPKAENGSRYIYSFCRVSPKLYIPQNLFEKILAQYVPGNLFLSEIGLKIQVGPLEYAGLGAFTAEDNTLSLTNIRYSKEPVRANKHTGAGKSKNVIVINGKTKFGAINTDAALIKTSLVADVTFGRYISQKNMTIPIEGYLEEATAELVIPLPSFRTQISYDGTMAFKENGHICKISDFVTEKVRWVDYEHTIEAPLDI